MLPRQGNRPQPAGGWRHLALQVDSIESAKAELEAKGVEFPNPVNPRAAAGWWLSSETSKEIYCNFVERPNKARFADFGQARKNN